MKIGLFFGAGAEISYGLPSGGKFAVDIFRQDPTEHKRQLRKQLKEDIDRRRAYATKWLPPQYWDKQLYAFGRQEFNSLVKSSIENNKRIFIDRLENIDNAYEVIVNKYDIDKNDINEKFHEKCNRQFGEETYSQMISINETVARDSNLFDSSFLSAALDIIKEDQSANELKKYTYAIIQLYLGAHGHEFISNINQNLLRYPEEFSMLDDLSSLFTIEFSKAGYAALELILDSEPHAIDNNSTIEDILSYISYKIIEDIFTDAIDYRKIIDENFRYLFSPKTDWAKFTKMVIFLNSTKKYIETNLSTIHPSESTGYYDDLTETITPQITAIGTSNYNNIFECKCPQLRDKVIHLNGSVHDYYNPYKNTVEIFNEEPPTNQIYVPFILTQSGLKPLTSVSMSRRYVDLYDNFNDSNIIISIGFGFNSDDNHINGMFRDLIEINSKKIVCILPIKEGVTEQDEVKKIAEKLRLDFIHESKINIIFVDKNSRKTSDGKTWLETVYERFSNEYA